MTNYLGSSKLYDTETKIVKYCVDHNLDFNNVTAVKCVRQACKNDPIKWINYDSKGKCTEDIITDDVGWEYSGNRVAVERVQGKIEALKEANNKQRFEENTKANKAQSTPDLDKLVDSIYNFNIMDGPSYLALVYFLMQLKHTRGDEEIPKYRADQKISLFLNGVQRSGKSSMVKSLIEVEKNYGIINYVNSAETFENRFEENLWKAHLNFCDEVVPSRIKTETLTKANDGGIRQLERKNQTPYNYDVNTNFIFASNDDISLMQRRVAVLKFGQRLEKIIPFEMMTNWMTTAMNSLPDFYWHPAMYNVISKANQTRLNPLAIELINGFLGSKLGHFNPGEYHIPFQFNTAQIYIYGSDKSNHIFFKSTLKKAVREALDYLVKKGFIDEFKYKGGTTKQYIITQEQYDAFREWADSINSSDEKLSKISKKELKELLRPYFAPVPTTPENDTTNQDKPSGDNPVEETTQGNSESKIDDNYLLPEPSPNQTEDVLPSFENTNDIKELSIDLETYSDVDLKKNTVYNYAESPHFDILLFGYSINGGEAQVVDLAQGEKIPENVLKALTDKSVLKWAFNASFERICLSAWLRKVHPEYFKGYETDEEALQNYLDPTSWRCSQIWANYLGYPLSLKAVGAELHLEEQKMGEGQKLISYFCVPCKPTQKNGMRTRNLPEHNLKYWETFKQYNKRDVEVEMAIQERFRLTPVPSDVWSQYEIDQKINDRGVKIDMDLAVEAIETNGIITEVAYSDLCSKTGIKNPNSGAQFKEWLATQGIQTKNIDKKAIDQLLIEHPTGVVADALKLKLQLSKSSVHKYSTMLDTACDDFRARGCLRFYGAFTTGRWAGRYIQLQNLPQNHIDDLVKARQAVKDLDYSQIKETFKVCAGKDSSGNKILKSVDVPEGLSQLIRTALIPEENHKFIVSDYSQIEARVLSVIAGETWRIEAFKEGKDIYSVSASQMFGVPVEKGGVNGELRVKGKIAELALGYGGSEGALSNMDKEKALKPEELPDIVKKWRLNNPRITQFWKECGKAAKHAITTKCTSCVGLFKFFCPGHTLFIDLPSGRSLVYRDVEVKKDKRGYEVISYRGSRGTKTMEITTYGAKLVENIIQGLSRDILAFALENLSNYKVVAHVHDEVIVEVPKDTDIKTITDIMEIVPPWIEGLPLKAEGYDCDFYQKQ